MQISEFDYLLSMSIDKYIAATLMDATYIGVKKGTFLKETRYRLRALRSAGGIVKIREHNPVGEVVIYENEAQFRSCWMAVHRVAVVGWD